MDKRTNFYEGLPKRRIRIITLILAGMYLILFLSVSLVDFPGGDGESIMMHILNGSKRP